MKQETRWKKLEEIEKMKDKASDAYERKMEAIHALEDEILSSPGCTHINRNGSSALFGSHYCLLCGGLNKETT